MSRIDYLPTSARAEVGHQEPAEVQELWFLLEGSSCCQRLGLSRDLSGD